MRRSAGYRLLERTAVPAARRRLSQLLPGLLTAAIVSLGCSSQADDTSGTPSEPVRVEVTLEEEEATPSGDTVTARSGQPVELVVTSDASDEIHVHSDPEHEFEVPAGSSEKVFRFTLDTPGTYEVESHELEVVIIRLQVR